MICIAKRMCVLKPSSIKGLSSTITTGRTKRLPKMVADVAQVFHEHWAPNLEQQTHRGVSSLSKCQGSSVALYAYKLWISYKHNTSQTLRANSKSAGGIVNMNQRRMQWAAQFFILSIFFLRGQPSLPFFSNASWNKTDRCSWKW